MPVDIRIVRIRDFVHLAPKGTEDLSHLKRVLSDASTIPGIFTDFNLLIDSRGLETNLPVSHLWELAKHLATIVQQGSSKGFRAKIAVLCPLERFDLAQFFSLCAVNRGLNVQPFTSIEELFHWMSESSTPSQG